MQHSIDVNALYARAEQAFAAGRLDDARRDLAEVERIAGDHPAVLHLVALVEKKRGDLAASRNAFERALALAPEDPQIANNLANLLGATGEPEAALERYRDILRRSPAFAEARYNMALLLEKMGRHEEALRELDKLVAEAPAQAKAHSARGGLLYRLGRLDEAAYAYDRALAIAPERPIALHGRARVAMERGEQGASDHYRRALARNPADLELRLGLAAALEAEGSEEAIPLLARAVAENPAWVTGHAQLARMRSEAGEEDFARSYEIALEQRPDDRALHAGHWRTLGAGGRYRAALDAIARARAHIGEDEAMRITEAVFASEAGDVGTASRLFETLQSDSYELLLAQGRHALRAGDAARASKLLEKVVGRRSADIAAWAHLSLAWRLTDDRRHGWLCEQPGLYAPRDIGLGSDELAETAALLRRLHRTRAHPIGQSLRGGTQTRGRLFWRREPEILRLREAIAAALRDFVSALPPRDESHPLLRHRDLRFDFEGSWSVRLKDAGFHVQHIHPEGILSSACYIALPESLGGEEDRAGWLEIGAPPAELGLDLPPLASIEPAPGRLALFPSYMFHGTRPFAEGERLTVAFDLVAR
ncbi:MAG: tetratricopeptide repeat protein [Sphingomonadaceae bacterium]